MHLRHGSHQNITLLDGGMGTLLETVLASHGLAQDPLWSARLLLTAPHTVSSAHLEYLRAGASVISTCTYQVSQLTLDKAGVSVGAAEIVELGLKAAVQARDSFYAEAGSEPSGVVIAVSVGAYGAMLGGGREYAGVYSTTELDALSVHYRDHIAAILQAAAAVGLTRDEFLIAFETIPSRAEVVAIRTALKAVDTAQQLRFWFSFNCATPTHLGHGDSVAETIAELAHLTGLEAVGVNCLPRKRALAALSPIISQAKELSIPAVVVYPNGRSFLVEPGGRGGAWEDPVPNEESIWAQECLQGVVAAIDGVAAVEVWLGGCCVTTPRHIGCLRDALGRKGVRAECP